MSPISSFRAIVVAVACLAAPLVQAQDAPTQDAATDAPPPDPQAVADTIGREVAEIRGLAFKRPVGVETQSGERFSMQANLGMDQLRAMLRQQPKLAEMVGEDIQVALASADAIPPFILETMMGAYLKGMGFVFAVQEQGWPAVDKLYTEYPPQSTEQILHPEKWFAREAAVAIEWPDFAKVKALRDWELLDDDVLGEFLWRTVFKEHGLADEAESASAGWGGDRYAVFKRKDSDATLLLWRTSWDSVATLRGGT